MKINLGYILKILFARKGQGEETIVLDAQPNMLQGGQPNKQNVRPMQGRDNLWAGLIGWLLLCYSVSVTGDLASAPHLMGWYGDLSKPGITPETQLFRPLWTLLYTTIAFSAWRLWMHVRIIDQKRVFSLFFIQLALNGVWPFIFFRMRDIGLSFMVIILLLFTIIGTIYAFRRIDKLASYLLYPYAGWIAFATILNAELWVLN